jgi:hypothetical protein
MDVLHVRDGLIREIVAFEAGQLGRFDLPASLPA